MAVLVLAPPPADPGWEPMDRTSLAASVRYPLLLDLPYWESFVRDILLRLTVRGGLGAGGGLVFIISGFNPAVVTSRENKQQQSTHSVCHG